MTCTRIISARTERGAGLPGALAVLATIAVAGTPVPASSQFTVRPVVVDFPRGSAPTRVATLKNEGKVPRTFRVYVADYDRAPDGEHRFLEAGEHERSCRDRLSVFPDQVRVEAGGSVQARITMEPGSRTCWSLVFFETTVGDTTGVRIGQRIGVKVFGSDGAAATEARVERVHAAPDAGGVRVVFDVVNSGGTVLRPTGDVELRGLDGSVVGSRELRRFTVLPGRTRRVDVVIRTRPGAGSYVAVPLLDIGADYLIGGQARLDLPAAGNVAAARGG